MTDQEKATLTTQISTAWKRMESLGDVAEVFSKSVELRKLLMVTALTGYCQRIEDTSTLDPITTRTTLSEIIDGIGVPSDMNPYRIGNIT
jgi:hypothetical protein